RALRRVLRGANPAERAGQTATVPRRCSDWVFRNARRRRVAKALQRGSGNRCRGGNIRQLAGIYRATRAVRLRAVAGASRNWLRAVSKCPAERGPIRRNTGRRRQTTSGLGLGDGGSDTNAQQSEQRESCSQQRSREERGLFGTGRTVMGGGG